ncbi:hypothetical protein HNY73_005688 [Argiope bruennichi]|uniref:Uncharacterized protein n=1 Tax=Argiope bruennichi TaxID=94029 RepID=A0A8T0FKE6_ARGBR|nr:hypothetical protein HNY73_005688 [Argiope bruennichi]
MYTHTHTALPTPPPTYFKAPAHTHSHLPTPPPTYFKAPAHTHSHYPRLHRHTSKPQLTHTAITHASRHTSNPSSHTHTGITHAPPTYFKTPAHTHSHYTRLTILSKTPAHTPAITHASTDILQNPSSHTRAITTPPHYTNGNHNYTRHYPRLKTHSKPQHKRSLPTPPALSPIHGSRKYPHHLPHPQSIILTPTNTLPR